MTPAEMPSLAFDGGNREVPGGLDSPVERVVVVGAGIAGLTVANALGHAGIECLVLEARDRIGGRLHTVELGGWPVDLGGSWIHTPVGNPMTRFVDLAQIPRRPGDVIFELAALDRGAGRLLAPTELTEVLMALDSFPAAAGDLRTGLGPDASVADAIDRFVNDHAHGARRIRDAVTLFTELDVSAEPEAQSLQFFPGNTLEYEGDYIGDLPGGGYRRVVESMAAGVDVRLGEVVEEVTVASGGVRARTSDGRVEQCSHLVVTVPLGALQRGAIAFDPPLPSERVATIDRLGFGRYEKVAMRFEDAFWRPAGVPHLMVLPGSRGNWTPFLVGLDAFDGGPILVAQTGGRSADRLNQLSDGEAVAELLGLIGEAIHVPVPEPIEVVRTAWVADPYAGGSYTYLPLGATSADPDAIGEPVGGRLLFAGEATTSARLAFADGAMTSGVREAKRLTGAPEVRLGPLT